MNFKVKKIRHKKSKIKLWQWFQDFFGRKKSLVLLVVGIFLLGIWGGVALLRSGFFGVSVSSIMPRVSILKEDPYGHTNVLFLGVAGQEEEGGNLSDSIMIVSINDSKPSVSMLSLPRDLYIDSEVGSRKINEIYAAARHKHGNEKGLDIVKRALSRFTNIELHYAAVVDFNVFEEVVDELGGVKLFVPEDISDPFYPDKNYGYQTFTIRKGIQTLNGKTALKYARSRKTSSDYSRAKRQQDLLFAIKEKAEESNLFFDINLLRSLFQSYQENVNTDIKFTEALALSKVAHKLNFSNLVTAVLNDDPSRRGGFLYAPAQEFYSGQFVLLPTNLRDTQKFIELTLIRPETLLENAQISIQNGSKIGGLAGDMAARFRRFGFHVIEVKNYDSPEPVFRSFYESVSSNSTPLTQKFIVDFLGFSQQVIPADPVTQTEPPKPPQGRGEVSLIDINVILGVTQRSL